MANGIKGSSSSVYRPASPKIENGKFVVYLERPKNEKIGAPNPQTGTIAKVKEFIQLAWFKFRSKNN